MIMFFERAKRLSGIFLTAVVLFLSSTKANAQSASDIEAAKAIAKSMGYSESDINSMIQKYSGGMSSSSSVQQQYQPAQRADVMLNNGYGVNTVNQKLANEQLSAAAKVNTDSLKRTKIYGHSIFESASPFMPIYNLPTPETYVLSAGDEIIIDVWGATSAKITGTISPEGAIVIENVGPVYVMGYTVSEAEKRLRSLLSTIYSGLEGENPNTFMQLSLGRVRSVTVHVFGDVNAPGSYTVPSLATPLSVMSLSGGISDIGSVRTMKLFRNGSQIGEFDLYRFMKGSRKASEDVRLQDNDIIRIPSAKIVVSIDGAINRPMKYEMKEGETLADLISFAGDMKAEAFGSSIFVRRIAETPVTDYNVPEEKFAEFKMKNGDQVYIKSRRDITANDVTVSGAVWNPGRYSISDTLRTVKDLIAKAGGLLDNTYMERALLSRIDRKTGLPVMENISLKNLLTGAVEDISLDRGDSLVIYTVTELSNQRQVSVLGEVNKSGNFNYKKGMTLSDALLLAGGVTDLATLSRIEVARRVRIENAVEVPDSIAEIVTLNLMSDPSVSEFALEPFDMVFVRRNPTLRRQVSVSIQGEVNFPGTYVIEKNQIRLSDLVEKSGNVTSEAYVKGAKLYRKLNRQEYERVQLAMEIARKQVGNGMDMTEIDSIAEGQEFTVVIDMEAAMNNPGKYQDIVLREGDRVVVPQMDNTVKVSGEVNFVNVLSYSPRLGLKDYIRMAGGYSQKAKKNKAFVVQMNGEVLTKASLRREKILPGAEIIVPAKEEKKGMSAYEIMGLASSSASVAAMVISIVNSLAR